MLAQVSVRASLSLRPECMMSSRISARTGPSRSLPESLSVSLLASEISFRRSSLRSRGRTYFGPVLPISSRSKSASIGTAGIALMNFAQRKNLRSMSIRFLARNRVIFFDPSTINQPSTALEMIPLSIRHMSPLGRASKAFAQASMSCW